MFHPRTNQVDRKFRSNFGGERARASLGGRVTLRALGALGLPTASPPAVSALAAPAPASLAPAGGPGRLSDSVNGDSASELGAHRRMRLRAVGFQAKHSSAGDVG